MEGLQVGRIVHYVDKDGYHNAAIVTFVGERDDGFVDLFVTSVDKHTYFVGDVQMDSGGECETWHWPERV